MKIGSAISAMMNHIEAFGKRKNQQYSTCLYLKCSYFVHCEFFAFTFIFFSVMGFNYCVLIAEFFGTSLNFVPRKRPPFLHPCPSPGMGTGSLS